jgi:hypothetical protein
MRCFSYVEKSRNSGDKGDIDFLIDLGNKGTFKIIDSLKSFLCLIENDSIDTMSRKDHGSIISFNIIDRFDKNNSSTFKIFSNFGVVYKCMNTKNSIS